MKQNFINMKWGMLPLFYVLHNDSDFNHAYVSKGTVFLLSLIFAPITIPLWYLGILLEKYAR